MTAAPATEQRTVTTTTTTKTMVPSFQSTSEPGKTWSYLGYVPPAGLKVNDINQLQANFS
jgi:hypothetical protein